MFDPIVYFFLLGAIAGFFRSELRLPAQIYEFVSILLLLSIGLKGGAELAEQPFLELLPLVLAVLAMGLLLPVLAFPVLKVWGRFSRADAASIAAHYGSVSVGTYGIAVAYLGSKGVSFEGYMPLLVAVLEVPAVLVGILLARGLSKETQWGAVAHEVFAGKGIILLLGGLAIGWLAGPAGLAPIKPMFFDLFKGVLALFLLEMGLIAAAKLNSLRRYGVFLVFFGIAMPLVSSLFGTALGLLFGLSVGGTMVLATLAASASYIAVPAAMRISVPEANPTLSLTASLGITFPFNVLIGINLYYHLAVKAHLLF